MSEHSAQAETQRAVADPPTDAQLILDLRDGDVEAYEELWRRHIGAALRQARRLTPHQPEDLAAEAFTTVLHQITVAGGGPDQNFRAYLFTVMRNLAIRWNRENRLILPLGESHDSVVDDGADRVIGDEDSQVVLRAFRTLPRRWQEVLWLAEVDEEPRPAIASRFAMSPNSVSALLRRARHGLRYRCLVEYVPEPLRTDRSHVARVLPDLVTGKLGPDTVLRVTTHLAGCGTCRDVHSELRGLSRRVKHSTLATLGFGALTMIFKDLGTAGVAIAATTVTGAAVGGLMAAGPISSAVKIAAVAVGVVAVAVPVTNGLWQPSDDSQVAVAAPSSRPAPPRPTAGTPTPVVPSRPPETTPAATPGAVVGTAVEIPTIDLWHPATPTPTKAVPTPVDPDTIPRPLAPVLPEATVSPGPTEPSTDPGTSSPSVTPDPSATPDAPSPSATPSPSTSSGPSNPFADSEEPPAGLGTPSVASGGTADGWLAPLLSGSGEPTATIAIHVVKASELDFSDVGLTYLVPPDAAGAWSFDLASLGLSAASYRATVWQVRDAESSPATVVEFTIGTLVVDGLLPLRTMGSIEAELDGIIITATAPGRQTVCLTASTGQQAVIPLGPDGSATRRIRFVGSGSFELEVSVCEGDRHGAPVRGTIIIMSNIHDPWDVPIDPGIIVEEP